MSAEIRHISMSGGEKGRKPETYRLIPEAFERSVKFFANGNRDLITTRILDIAKSFWAGRDALYLTVAAAYAESAMGGPLAARYHVARVYGIGALKYDDDNWKKGYPWSWSYDALFRHLEAIRRGELIDVGTPENPGTGAPHWANVWWHCATLWTFATEGLGTDDRPRDKEVK